MEYKKLRVLSYDREINLEEEYVKRLNSYSTIKTNFYIHPFVNEYRKIDIKHNLFYVYLQEHVQLMQIINTNSKEINELSEKIPGIAKQKIMLNYLIEEIQGTNETEGVRSSREEVGEALSAVKNKSKKKNIRFKGIANMYFSIFENSSVPINKPEDIRNIYDALFLDDISNRDKPDGELFRKGSVSIMDGLDVVHRGNPDEKSIVSDLQLLIEIMNNKSIPFLIKSIISHYILEYIHPFYDGNGRLGRYIISQYLSRKLDYFTGISISNSVNKNKKDYSEAFSEVSENKNFGDLTFFVEMMLKLIIKAQDNVKEDLIENNMKLRYFEEAIKELELEKISKKILYILIQDYEFSFFGQSMYDKDLVDLTEKSRHIVNKSLKELVEKGYIEKVGIRPSIHEISADFKETLSLT